MGSLLGERQLFACQIGMWTHEVTSSAATPVLLVQAAAMSYLGSLVLVTEWNALKNPRCACRIIHPL